MGTDKGVIAYSFPGQINYSKVTLLKKWNPLESRKKRVLNLINGHHEKPFFFKRMKVVTF
jgi:hypothetical protein